MLAFHAMYMRASVLHLTFQGLFFQTKAMPDDKQPRKPIAMQVFFEDRQSGEWKRLSEIAHKVQQLSLPYRL